MTPLWYATAALSLLGVYVIFEIGREVWRTCRSIRASRKQGKAA